MTQTHYSFVLIPGFSLVAFSCAIDALRGANLILDRPEYHWDVIAANAKQIVSSSDIPVPVNPLSFSSATNLITICGGVRSHDFQDSTLTSWLHEQAAIGVRIGAFSDGSFVAAAAGLFDHVPSTIHWRCQDAYRERFPNLEIKTSMIEIGRNRFSCAGGTSSLDLMLHFIREDHGDELVGLIAQNFFHDTIRDGAREQHLTNAFRIAAQNPAVSRAIMIMEQSLETPLNVESLAESVSLSRRQLDRIFNQSMNCSPKQFYNRLRLTRASGLLLQTSLSVGEIAIGCGFQSASHLARNFRKHFGETPGKYRFQRSIDHDAGTRGF